MDMRKAITEAIEKNLSTEIGVALKERLKKADVDADTAERLTTDVNTYRCEARALKSEVETLKALENDKEKIKEREQAVSLREKVIELREKHSLERVSDMRALVEAVFANNRFKYSAVGQIPIGDQNGYVNTYPTSREVEGEG